MPNIDNQGQYPAWSDLHRHFQAVEERKAAGHIGLVKDILVAVLISLLLCYPLAYLGQVLQIITDGICGIFDSSLSNLFKPFEQSWFYATLLERCLYWGSLVLLLSAWMVTDGSKKEEKRSYQVFLGVAALIYCVVSIINFNLFVSTLVGPFIIILGLASLQNR